MAPLAPVDDARGSADYRLDAARTLTARDPRRAREHDVNAGNPDGTSAFTGERANRSRSNGAAALPPRRCAPRQSGTHRDKGGMQTPATAAPARCCSTVPRCAAAWCRWPRPPGGHVETVEGLAAKGRLNRLQRAFLRHGAAQCGACTPGMLIAATELLRASPRPRAAEVMDGLGGVLCRCTGYRKIVAAVLDAAGNAPQPLSTPPAGGRRRRPARQARRRAQAHRCRALRRRRRAGGRALAPRRPLAPRFRQGRARRSGGDGRRPARRGAATHRRGRALQPHRHLSRPAGPAGARRRRRALPGRSGGGARWHARGGHGGARRRPADPLRAAHAGARPGGRPRAGRPPGPRRDPGQQADRGRGSSAATPRQRSPAAR